MAYGIAIPFLFVHGLPRWDDPGSRTTRFGSDVLFTNQKKSSVWHLKPCGELDLFAGSDKEEGIVDGPIKTCRFKQPMGICTEFDSVVYVCDAQANSLMVCTEVKQCSLFLNAMGSLYNAFNIHC